MIRQKWKDLLGVLVFLAIIASLISWVLKPAIAPQQTVQNTQAMEIAAYQELINNISEFNALSVADQETADMMSFIYNDVGDGTAIKAIYGVVTLFRHGDIAYFMYEKGAISEARLISVLGPLPMIDEQGLIFWKQYKQLFVKPYQNYIDREVGGRALGKSVENFSTAMILYRIMFVDEVAWSARHMSGLMDKSPKVAMWVG